MCVFFFFQAEDGIRDGRVTGVQTCALPILPSRGRSTFLIQPSGASLPVSFSGCGVRPMWRTLISMTGASAGRESIGWLAEEGSGEECVAAFFAMPAV